MPRGNYHAWGAVANVRKAFEDHSDTCQWPNGCDRPSKWYHTTHHMALSVRGALMSKDRDLKGWIRDDAGRLLSPREARQALMDELANGNEFIPFVPCDNFDPKSGCRGHRATAAPTPW